MICTEEHAPEVSSHGGQHGCLCLGCWWRNGTGGDKGFDEVIQRRPSLLVLAAASYRNVDRKICIYLLKCPWSSYVRSEGVAVDVGQ